MNKSQSNGMQALTMETEMESLKYRVKELEGAHRKEKARINAALGDDLFDSILPWAENVVISILKLKGDKRGLELLGVVGED